MKKERERVNEIDLRNRGNIRTTCKRRQKCVKRDAEEDKILGEIQISLESFRVSGKK